MYQALKQCFIGFIALWKEIGAQAQFNAEVQTYVNKGDERALLDLCAQHNISAKRLHQVWRPDE